MTLAVPHEWVTATGGGYFFPLQTPRGIRVNVVSPPWVTGTLKTLNMDPSLGKPAVEVGKGYVKSIEGQQSGEVIEV